MPDGSRGGYRLQLNDGAVKKLLTGSSGSVYQAARRAGAVTRDRAKLDLTANRLVNTGLLRNSIESTTFVRGKDVVSRVGTDVAYARYVHDGTQGPIVPRRARVLRFKPKGSSTFVFAAKVRGTRETGRYSPFLANALKKLKPSDFT